MAVNLIDNEQIHVIQNGSDITLDIQNDALKNEDVVVGSIRSKNIFDKATIVAGDIVDADPTIRLISRQALWLEVGTYTFSCNLTSPFRYNLQVQNEGIPPLSSYPTYIYNTPWKTSSELTTTFTITTAGWFSLLLSKENNATLTVNDVKDFNFQLEEGSTATTYSPYQNLNLEIKSKYVSGTPDSNGFLSTGLDVHNIIIGVAGISINAGFFTPFIEKNANRLTIQCKTWDQNPITTSVSFTVYYIEI